MELPYQQKIIRFANTITNTKQLYHTFKLSVSCCELCHGEELVHPLLCKYCLADLPLFQLPACQFDLLNWPAINKLFPQRKFDHLLALTPYVWPMDSWLKQFKYQNRFELADLFGFLLNTLWQQISQDELPTALLAVPIHIKKWQLRGYNQAHLIAKAFAQYADIQYFPDALVRTKFAPSQVGQSGKQRRSNIKQAFALTNNIKAFPDHLLLLDDVITTGTTVNSIARLLKHQGVKKVTVLTLALTLPK